MGDFTDSGSDIHYVFQIFFTVYMKASLWRACFHCTWSCAVRHRHLTLYSAWPGLAFAMLEACMHDTIQRTQDKMWWWWWRFYFLSSGRVLGKHSLNLAGQFIIIWWSDKIKLLGFLVHSLWPSATCQPRSGSKLAQAMACCLMAPSHYFNQFWLFIKGVLSLLRHSIQLRREQFHKKCP